MKRIGNRVSGSVNRVLRILGTRGVPAAHSGFETFAESLALYLVAQGWRVVVYCQEDGGGPVLEDTWQGVERVRIPVSQSGPWGTIVFDWRATWHAAEHRDLCLTLGYNTAVFCGVLRLKGIPNLINMDGIEWRRLKWGPVAKTWFWLNDWIGCWVGNHLVADHPEIKAHLMSRVAPEKITTIPYGAERLTWAPVEPLRALGLEPGRYLTLIARPEPENSILEIVRSFSAKARGYQLVVLGKYKPESNVYHRSVIDAAGAEVKFVGAIFDKTLLRSLRFHCVAYVHGHSVGGTNPSLVEALGAGNAVIARDNRFNRWVAKDSAVYFDSSESFMARLEEILTTDRILPLLREASRKRFDEAFTWEKVLSAYESLLMEWLPEGEGARAKA
jgi:glycosyltransferase involved in cell wall biosynthesis